jgi:hypothetical protein
MSGSVPGPLGHLVADTAVGALLGLGAVCAVGYGGLLIAHTLGQRSTVLVRLLCAELSQRTQRMEEQLPPSFPRMRPSRRRTPWTLRV